jgi:hypothetical protein
MSAQSKIFVMVIATNQVLLYTISIEEQGDTH